MAFVYEGAYCTIAATAAADGAKGLFVGRECPSLIQLPCCSGDVESGFMYLGASRSHTAVNELLQGPLNKRGWVLQERLFSRRTIHFAADQIYWECDKLFIGEDQTNARNVVDSQWTPTRSLLYYILEDILGPMVMPRLKFCPRLNPIAAAEDPMTPKDFYNFWTQLVRFYSRCGLTKGSDRQPALLSLSTEIEKLVHDQYHEGHWFRPGDPKTIVKKPLFFYSSLLWKPEKGNYLSLPGAFRAPSWSWLSLDGPLDFADLIYGTLVSLYHECSSDVDILRLQIWQPCGLPPQKSLFISGCLLPVSKCMACAILLDLSRICPACDIFLQDPERCDLCKLPGLETLTLVDREGTRIEGSFACDAAEDQPPSFWLLPIYTRYMKKSNPAPLYHTLMLKEVSGQSVDGFVFRRIRVGHVEDSRIFESCTRRFVVII